jgi:glucuronosyltransferase
VLVLSFLAASISIVDMEAARILGLFHFNGKSHFVMSEALLKSLAARGHQVYVVGHFPQKKPIPNYTDISVEGSYRGVFNSLSVQSALEFGQYYNLLIFFFQTANDICKTVLEHPRVQELISSNNTFDLIITEILGPDCMNGFSHRFEAPIISMISSVILPWGNDRIGNPDHPGYIPNYFFPYSQHMTLGQRLTNSVFTEALKFGLHIFSELPAEKLLKKHFGQNVPTLSELKKKTSLILVNSHFSLNNPRPTVPGFVEVGGLHIPSGGKLTKVIYDKIKKNA